METPSWRRRTFPTCPCRLAGLPVRGAVAAPLLAVFLFAGCEDAEARRVIEPASMSGKAMLAMTGEPSQLIRSGEIDARLRVPAADHVMIDAWVIRARPADKPAHGTVLLLHPLMTSKSWFLSLGKELSAAGWDVVLPDTRAHGDSGGRYITWGAKEKRDLKAVMDRAIAECKLSDHIYVFGASMGGCLAIQYGAFDKRCRGVIAVAPPTGIVGVAQLMMPLASEAVAERAARRAGQIAQFDFRDSSALDAAAHLDCPLLLVHGTADVIVPIAHSRQLLDAAKKPKKLIEVPLADHVGIQCHHDKWFADLLANLADHGLTGPEIESRQQFAAP